MFFYAHAFGCSLLIMLFRYTNKFISKTTFIAIMSFWLVQSPQRLAEARILLNPSLEKRGMGRFYGEWTYSKNPPQSPFAKGGRCKERFPTSVNDRNPYKIRESHFYKITLFHKFLIYLFYFINNYFPRIF